MNYYDRDQVYENILKDIEILNSNIENIKLEIFNETSQTYKLINKLKEESRYLIKNIKELKNPFLLYVIGPGKYGKSTLINSLIQSKLLETKDIPNTWKIDSLINSNKYKIEIINDENILYEFKYEEGLKLLKDEEMKFRDSKKIVRKNFDEYKKKNQGTLEQLKKYKNNLEKLHLYKSNICEVRYYVKQEGILSDFIIIDTPGLNQNLLKNTKKRMIDYYKRADGIIWILDGQNIVSKSSYDLLNELKTEYTLGDKNNKIICVINKIDIIRNKKDSICKVKNKVDQIYSDFFKDIIMISSKEALDGYINDNLQLIESSNINALRESIDINFKRKSEEIQIKSKYENLVIMSNYCTVLVNEYKRNFYYQISKYEESKSKIEVKIENITVYIEKNISRYLTLNNLLNNNIYNEVKELEEFLEYEINNLKKYLFHITEIASCLIKENNFVKIDILHTKELLYVDKNLVEYKHLLNKTFIKLDIANKKRKEEVKKYNLINSIEVLKNSVEEKIYIVLLEIKSNLDTLIEKSFRERYVDYKYIKNHLVSINNIDIILKKWGNYNEKFK